MTNWDKYKDELMKLEVCGLKFAIKAKTGEVSDCISLKCRECLFDDDCQAKNRKAWLDEEYTEPKGSEIDWSKVPVDTPILVWNKDGERKMRRHFSRAANGMIYAWNDGKTAYTSEKDVMFNTRPWLHAEIAPGIDCTGWYKDE